MATDKQNIILAILTGTAFILLFGFFTFLVVLNFVKRKRKLLLEHQIRESKFQQELLQAQLEMQEHTFRTVSQEIHDNVGQILSLAKVNLNILAMEEGTSSRILDVKDQVTHAITELRHLSSGYFSDKLADMGLLAAIKSQLEQLKKTGLFAVEFQSDLEQVEIDKNKTIFIYRMVQEVLNNAVKHSKAEKVSVQVFEKEGQLHINISDNGKGFIENGDGFTPGIGLNSIRQRAAIIDATVAIRSGPGKGTSVYFLCKTG
jgi:signal transduction histidine kinase